MPLCPAVREAPQVRVAVSALRPMLVTHPIVSCLWPEADSTPDAAVFPSRPGLLQQQQELSAMGLCLKLTRVPRLSVAAARI